MNNIETALAGHAFEHLFIECLGWDRVRANVSLEHEGVHFTLAGVAQKRGFTVFLCPTHPTVLANRRVLCELQRKLRKTYHEHILILACETPRKQVWQWAAAIAGDRRFVHRELPFFSSAPPPRLLERIAGLSVALAAEEQAALPDVLVRMRQALLPDSKLNLPAKHPWHAAQRDALAMAVKRGEAGALGKLVEFHIPLARWGSRKLVRWFEMDSDDAEQTAMIGLLKAARRFDPELGYQFSTYASYWIRQCCQRLGLRWGLPIRVPTRLFWPCYKMAFVEAKLRATYGERDARPRFEQELRQAGISWEQWTGFCQARHLVCFTDVDKAQRARLDRIDASAIEDDAIAGEIHKAIHHGLELLKPRQAQILKLRYGIGHRKHTLQEVGGKLGITRERVRQIQVKAEQRLERFLTLYGYRDERAAKANTQD